MKVIEWFQLNMYLSCLTNINVRTQHRKWPMSSVLWKIKQNHELIIVTAPSSLCQLAAACSIPDPLAVHGAELNVHMLTSRREKNTLRTKVDFFVVPSVYRGLCMPKSSIPLPPNGTLLPRRTIDVAQLSHPLLWPNPETLEVKWHHGVGSSGQVLIEIWMNRSERMNSTMNDPPITTQQSCLALMNS